MTCHAKQGACAKFNNQSEFKSLKPPPPMTYGGSSSKRPQGSCVAKDKQKKLKLKDQLCNYMHKPPLTWLFQL